MELDKIISLCAIVYLFLISENGCFAVAPLLVWGGVGAGASALYYFKNSLSCRFEWSECCAKPWISFDYKGLEANLSSKVYGQHLVKHIVTQSIRGHTANSDKLLEHVKASWTGNPHILLPEPKKALVLSLHGWTGGGKNHVSKIIADNLYQLGLKSSFVHLFSATLHFTHENKVDLYKDQLRNWIKGNVSLCPYQLFIFDEMDKMPPSLIDVIKPFIDYYPEIDGVDYRKSIFLFLSNTGGNEITLETYKYWKNGQQRETITHKSMESIIQKAAFYGNEQPEGGLWHSKLITSSLIDFYVPFLPLERPHVRQCIQDELEAKGHHILTLKPDFIELVINELDFVPENEVPVYSKNGCKRVISAVSLAIEEYYGGGS